jgi:peptidoglycan/LPS O-acetylase OafA/YrhL
MFGMPTLHLSGDKRIADIEFLRGIAIVFVLIFHAKGELITWPMPILDHILDHYFNFWMGVDVFFAVSGFVIARRLVPALQSCRSVEERSREIIRFWIRRSWRLIPSAWLWLALILLSSALFNESGAFESFHTNFESVIAGLLSVANVRFAYAFPFLPYGPSSPYWSLSLEEQFYLVLPLLVVTARDHLALALVGMAAIVFCLPPTALLGTFRVHAILLGVLLALFSNHPSYRQLEPVILGRSAPARWAVLGLALSCLATLGPLNQRIAPGPLSFDAIALLSVGLVFVASYDRDYLCRAAFLKRCMLWAGSRSYALYLVHMPVYCLTRELWFRLSPPGTVFGGGYDALYFLLTAAPIVLVLAELNYHFIECPGRRRGLRIAARWSTDAPVAAAGAGS